MTSKCCGLQVMEKKKNCWYGKLKILAKLDQLVLDVVMVCRGKILVSPRGMGPTVVYVFLNFIYISNLFPSKVSQLKLIKIQ